MAGRYVLFWGRQAWLAAICLGLPLLLLVLWARSFGPQTNHRLRPLGLRAQPKVQVFQQQTSGLAQRFLEQTQGWAPAVLVVLQAAAVH